MKTRHLAISIATILYAHYVSATDFYVDTHVTNKELTLIAVRHKFGNFDSDSAAENTGDSTHQNHCTETIADTSIDRHGCSFSQKDDRDGDSVSNTDEVFQGTLPENPDTDGDGLNDGEDPFPLDAP